MKFLVETQITDQGTRTFVTLMDNSLETRQAVADIVGRDISATHRLHEPFEIIY